MTAPPPKGHGSDAVPSNYVSVAEANGLIAAARRGSSALTPELLTRLVLEYGRAKAWYTTLELAVAGLLDISIDGDVVTVSGDPLRRAGGEA